MYFLGLLYEHVHHGRAAVGDGEVEQRDAADLLVDVRSGVQKLLHCPLILLVDGSPQLAQLIHGSTASGISSSLHGLVGPRKKHVDLQCCYLHLTYTNLPSS